MITVTDIEKFTIIELMGSITEKKNCINYAETMIKEALKAGDKSAAGEYKAIAEMYIIQHRQLVNRLYKIRKQRQ